VRRIDPTAWFPRASCRAPLILFSHGVYGRPEYYSRLLAHLASEGFVVLAPHHPDRTEVGDEFAERTLDMTYLLDHLKAVADRVARGLAGRIDATRVGIAGHSFGGATAAEVAATDPRVRAAVAMAGGGTADAARSIRVPFLALAGGRDRLIPAAFVRRFVAAIPASTPHRLIVLRRAGHNAYGNGCAAFHACRAVATCVTRFLLAYVARDGRRRS
jgi:predicted dienelactone hydrolase